MSGYPVTVSFPARPATGLLSTVLFLTLMWLVLGAGDIMAQTTTWVSKDSSGNEGDRANRFPSISANGRYTAFESDSTNLVPDDTNGWEDIFVHHRETGVTTRVNVDSNGNQANSQTLNPSLSADGRYVTFWSLADNLVPNDTNMHWDAFVHDRETGATARVCISSSGEQGNSGCGTPFISADGRYVAFGSFSDNLVTGDTNELFDTFIHDRETGETTRVSVDSEGNQADGGGYRVSVSADGRFVVFESPFNNLVPDDTNGVEDIFVRDRDTGETTRVSVDSDGNEANGASEIYWAHAVSVDGRYVAFESAADNLVPNDTNGVEDIFVHDRETGATTRVSVDSDGNQANGYSGERTSISATGRYVAFWSGATNLVPNDTNGLDDVFVHDRETGETIRVSVTSEGNEANGGSIEPSISPDGRYVAFASWGDNLVPEDTSNVDTWEIYAHGPLTAETVDLSGTVNTPDGMDICAMVLASGQFMFTCDPVGVFSLTNLPREDDDTVKRQIYADGFLPKIDVFTDSTYEAVIMVRSGACPSYNVSYDPGVFPESAGKRINISGQVLLQDSQTPICAMALANGQYMFSCDGSGNYALNIPLDTKGQFKLQVYADGFAPTIQTFDEFQAVNDVRMARAAECQ